MDFKKITKDIENGQYKPIYFLQGEEPFYIDLISNLIQKKVLNENEQEFNQTILYGRDTTVEDIVNVSKRFPMMAPYQVVIVKEAQHLIKTIEKLIDYVNGVASTTILVINYKNKKLDKRKALGKLLNYKGYIFDSDPIKDYRLPEWIVDQGKIIDLKVHPKAAILLAEFLGNDLSSIISTLDKLKVVLDDQKEISADVVHEHVGFSKEFNLFELQNAIAEKNVMKANLIIRHFGHNSKNYPMVLTISSLYVFFTKLMKYHFYVGKFSEGEIAKKIGVHTYFLKQYKVATRFYSKNKLARIFGYLREYDLKSKGVGNYSSSENELMKELIFKIMH